MRAEFIIKYLGYVLICNSVFLFIAFLISFFNNETSAMALFFSSMICVILGLIPIIFVEKSDSLTFKEGIYIVVVGWLITCITGMIPYIMWGGEFTLINAWFESVSGFTTTGSSILNDIEGLPLGILFWRSATHWIGGVGIIIFVLLIIPQASTSRMTLLNTDMSDLSKTNFRYQTRQIIKILGVVYIGLTLMETILLVIAGMSLFDAINHSFATIATGGFSTKNLSIGYFNNFRIELIITFFMIFSGIHFGLLYMTLIGKKENIFNSKVVRFYLIILFIGVIFIALKLYLSEMYNFGDSIRVALFQVVSLGTTTGFATQETNVWPSSTQIILMYFTIQCAMVGSTSGGLKFDRLFIFFKSFKKQIKLIQHPQAVVSIKLDNQVINNTMEWQVLIFIVIYIFTFFMTTLILTALDIDLLTAFSASIATIGNVGPGFGNVSSFRNFSSIPDFGKFVLTINMLLGRLEILSIIVFIMINRKKV